MRTGKLTARALAWALRTAGRKLQKEAHKTPHGRQSVRQLMKQGEATNSLPVEAPRQFDRVARRWNVDYAFYKNGDGKYLLFFKSKQADAITACFGEYSRRVLDRPRVRRVPILERMKRAGELLRQRPPKERAKEAEREER
nr:PcfB family protein [uncultured Oscillibacter sp.]